MPEKVKYLSPEWRDEAERMLSAELSPEKMNHITSSMSNICQNCPDGKDRFMLFKYDNGELSEFVVGKGDWPKAEFTISGDYETFVKISKAELGSQVALMSGKLKFKGNMVKALRLASIADRLSKVLSKIDAEY
jgi:putative sterol carrier protein